MRKYILMFVVAVSNPFAVIACDICGCGAGNSYIGILPDFRKRIVGMRYRYNEMLTHVGVGGSTSYLTTSERFNTLELWAGWNLNDHLRVMAAMPYNINERENQHNTRSKRGMGDVTASLFYQVIDQTRSATGGKLLVQNLWIGGGLKVPSGKYSPTDKSDNEGNNLFQLGTGSFDFNIGFMYDIRLRDAGININSNYKVNTANKYVYLYGNKFSLNVQGYYKFNRKNKSVISPNAGVQYEKAQPDVDDGLKVTVSGGSLLAGTLGVEAGFSKFAVGCNFQGPISQNLANKIVRAQNRIMLHMAISL